MKNKKGKSFLGMLLLLIAIGVFGYFGYSTMNQIKLGLDLAGGVSITYQAVKDNPTDEEMSDTRYKLEQRAQQYSEEAQVYLQGDNRITIEIPGATDATTILEEMGKPGSLYFIKQTNDDGTENYTYDSSTGEYVLNGKTIEELEEDGSVVLTGKDVESAEAMHQQNSTTKATESVVQLKMTDEGKQKFADATQEAYSAGKSIGIYYDEKFVSVPSVNAVISDGTAVISGGNMDWDEATSLASTLRIGSLSLELEELRSNVVVCTRKRKCPRIRHDTCSWYCSFHVQRHGCFQTAGQQPVRYGTEGCEILRNQERAQGISICGKEKDFLHDLLHSAACRSGQHDFHASDKGKRTELQP